MSQLTQDQARTIAEEFFEVAKAVGDFRFAHFDALTQQQHAVLHNLQQQLSSQSNHFTAEAIQLTLDDLQPTLEHLGAVTQQVNDAVTTLNDVRKVITIATSFVSLGAAIASGSPGTIASAVQDTIDAVQGA
jgi:hypothetical protein